MELIGLSLSFCVRDIMLGLVKEEDVQKIIAGTCIRDDEGLERVLKSYRESYWVGDPWYADVVARRLWDTGKVEQPRLKNSADFQYIGNYHWLEVLGEGMVTPWHAA